MTLLSLVIFLVPMAIGLLTVHLLWPNPKSFLLKFSLGIAVGLGLVSLLYFVFLSFLAGKTGFFAILLVLLAVLLWGTRKTWRDLLPYFERPQFSWVQVVLATAFLAITAFTAATLIGSHFAQPHGEYDAWMIWNRASRFIFRGGADWQNAFSEKFYWFFHPDYPLLVPLTNAWVWDVLKTESLRVPFLQGATYLFGSTLLLFGAVNFARGLSQASLAAAILLGTGGFVLTASAQLADVPLATFILAVVVCFYLYLRLRSPGILSIAGFCAGLAAWTKNEGLIFLVLSVFILSAMIAHEDHKKQKFAWYFAGLAFPLIILVYFKLSLAPSNDLTSIPSQEMLQRILDPVRYWQIGAAVVDEIRIFSGWAYLIPLLFLYYFLLRDKEPSMARWRTATLIAFVVQVATYLGAFLITHLPLEVHLDLAFDRILLHIYPTSLFVLFSSTTSPEKIFSVGKIQRSDYNLTHASHH